MVCLDCGKEIGNISRNRICHYCGFTQYKKSKEVKINKKNTKSFSDEELFAIGLYPDSEGYKMSLISRILGK
ncbi:MAG: hypothetical protein NC089_04505 [Bacteroides sp.]|nr:hypothetical protein [Bacteroides sp.]MCM1548655.1 hypothetical protein [Clostridium sp.]